MRLTAASLKRCSIQQLGLPPWLELIQPLPRKPAFLTEHLKLYGARRLRFQLPSACS